jgi:hypothetical protein
VQGAGQLAGPRVVTNKDGTTQTEMVPQISQKAKLLFGTGYWNRARLPNWWLVLRIS